MSAEQIVSGIGGRKGKARSARLIRRLRYFMPDLWEKASDLWEKSP